VDEVEARSILQQTIQRLRSLSYAELVDQYLGEVDAFEITADSGVEYQIEVEAFWDDPRKPNQALRVIAAIDDGRGWRSLSPLTDSFILTPDGSFIGE
jgi:hypothetical protein